MMLFSECNNIWITITGVVAIISMIFNVGCAVVSVTFHTPGRYKLISLITSCFSIFMLQLISDWVTNITRDAKMYALARVLGRLPFCAVFLTLCITMVAGVFIFLRINKVRQSMITVNSIKETIDSLPDGLCFYEKNGHTIMVNTKMNMLSSILTGHEIMNGKVFLQELDSGKLLKGRIIRRKPGLYIELEDHTVWNFRHVRHQTEKEVIYELIAYDVTEQTELYRKLKEKNLRMENVNQRLKRYNREMEIIVAEKETLESKIRIHDNLGRILLATRAYLMDPENNVKKSELIKMWKLTTSVLKNEAENKSDVNLKKMLAEAAESLGVEVSIQGKIPGNSRAENIFIAAVHESLTNTVRHGKGNHLFCSFKEDEDSYTGEFRNNGIKPDKIIEGNGLQNLRKIVESSEGKMEFVLEPEFVLRIKLEKRSLL